MNFSRIYVTLAGAGYLPKMPGTWGSLVSLPIIWFLKDLPYQMIWLAIVTFVSWAITRQYLIQYKKENEDPKEVVIDEFLGLWVALLFVSKSYLYFFLGFMFFRIFDMLKPWPISWADNIKGNATKTAWGIILDDLMAGATSAVILGVLISVFS